MIDPLELRSNILFRDFELEEIENIKLWLFVKQYKKGSILFFEGMTGGILYLVKSGLIEIYKKKGEEELLLSKFGPGDFLGEMSLFDNAPRSATARVKTDSDLLVITKQSFEKIMESHPRAANKILIAALRVMSHRLRETNNKLVI
jgi:CRP-like cAMP-binding protein